MKNLILFSMLMMVSVFASAQCGCSFDLDDSWNDANLLIEQGGTSQTVSADAFLNLADGNFEVTYISGASAMSNQFTVECSGMSEYVSPSLSSESFMVELSLVGCILPVEITAYKIFGDEFIWTTESEINNWQFVVQISKDAVEYSNFKTIYGQGTSEFSKTYSVYLGDLPSDRYVRLIQYDFDGSEAIYETLFYKSSNDGLVQIFQWDGRLSEKMKLEDVQSGQMYIRNGRKYLK